MLQMCIHSTVRTKKQKCRNGALPCGFKCYDPDFDVCCPSSDNGTGDNWMVYSRISDGDQCCGDKAYFSWEKTCCNGRLFNRPGLKCCCSQSIAYDPSSHQCIENRNDSTWCKVVGCPDQIRSKRQLKKSKLEKGQWIGTF